MTAETQRTPTPHWLALWMMATALGAPVGIVSYQVNSKVLTLCADGNSSGSLTAPVILATGCMHS